MVWEICRVIIGWILDSLKNCVNKDYLMVVIYWVSMDFVVVYFEFNGVVYRYFLGVVGVVFIGILVVVEGIVFSVMFLFYGLFFVVYLFYVFFFG